MREVFRGSLSNKLCQFSPDLTIILTLQGLHGNLKMKLEREREREKLFQNIFYKVVM